MPHVILEEENICPNKRAPKIFRGVSFAPSGRISNSFEIVNIYNLDSKILNVVTNLYFLI